MARSKPSENAIEPLPNTETFEGCLEVLKRASKGDSSVLPMVKQLFDNEKTPAGNVLEIYSDIFRHAITALTKTAAGHDIATKEAFERKIRSVRDDLAGPSPTPLELILSERIALCWFDAIEMDRRFHDSGGMSFKEGEYQERQRDRAQYRFLAACSTLARIFHRFYAHMYCVTALILVE